MARFTRTAVIEPLALPLCCFPQCWLPQFTIARIRSTLNYDNRYWEVGSGAGYALCTRYSDSIAIDCLNPYASSHLRATVGLIGGSSHGVRALRTGSFSSSNDRGGQIGQPIGAFGIRSV